eukprot:1462700-Ditylum_brightwellii.AAC.1
MPQKWREESAKRHISTPTVVPYPANLYIYISIKIDQRVAIKEVVQGVTDAHPAVQGCWEKMDLLVKEFLNYLCRRLSWGRVRRSLWCCGG